MNNKTRTKGLAILSGSPFSGKSILGYGLAARLAKEDSKTLFLDFQFERENSSKREGSRYNFGHTFNEAKDLRELVSGCDSGFDIIRLCPPDSSVVSEGLLERFSAGIADLSDNYDFVIISAPCGLNPLAFLVAGMCDEIALMIDPDASAVASSYCVLKALATEGMQEKVAAIFSNVNSAEHANSLRRKFDSLTSAFLDLKLRDGGFTLSWRGNDSSDSTENNGYQRASDYVKSAHLETFLVFQNETENASLAGAISSSGEPVDLEMDNL